MEVAASNSKQFLLPMAPPRDPNSPSSSTSSSSPSSAASPSSHPPPPPSPRPAPRIIDTTPFPTTFVQADTASFKQVVQMLTGAADMPPPSSQTQAQRPPAKTSHGGGVPCRAKKPAFKLYERRSGMKNLKMIAPLAMAAAAAAGASPRAAPELLLSPSVLDFPSLALSPVTPLVPDPFNRSASGSPGEEQQAMAEERAAIARKGFFLHPSPRAAAEPPRLLPLFPVTSPRMAAAAAPSSEL